MIHLRIRSAAPPTAVLAAIRDYAAQWRLSEVPDWAQRAGILAVECRVRGAAYRLWYTRQAYWGALIWLELRGSAEPAPDGGTQLVLSVGCRPRPSDWAILAVSCVVLTFTVAIGALPWPMLLLLPVGFGLQGWLIWETSQSLTRRNEPQADYLIRRVEAALERVAPEPAAAESG